jgi:hypothetical protein
MLINDESEQLETLVKENISIEGLFRSKSI